jgi:DNA-directed RNA polymerase subunit omega
MARITVEDCLEKVPNRFALIHLAAKRVRQLRKGAEPLVLANNSDNVIALREIAAGKVIFAQIPAQTKPVEQTNETEASPSVEIVEGITSENRGHID